MNWEWRLAPFVHMCLSLYAAMCSCRGSLLDTCMLHESDSCCCLGKASPAESYAAREGPKAIYHNIKYLCQAISLSQRCGVRCRHHSATVFSYLTLLSKLFNMTQLDWIFLRNFRKPLDWSAMFFSSKPCHFVCHQAGNLVINRIFVHFKVTIVSWFDGCSKHPPCHM